jgi:hypothetical protein
MAGFREFGDEPSGSGATELVYLETRYIQANKFSERRGEAAVTYQSERTQENISFRTHDLLREVEPEVLIPAMRLSPLQYILLHYVKIGQESI